ncbi:MAG: hypothetical protein C5B60_01845 [Chloroflexi bacterium]|nr:MAG: hypothetical protein C5B60_01845 [Chloroflexota bacterium]
MEAEFPFISPLITFRYWTQPALLQQWWPEQAEIQPRTGGSYHLSWPQMGWHLRGQYLIFEPPTRLAFSWRWDHDPAEEATREVRLTFEPLASLGTRLLLTHGSYQDTPPDQQIRLEHHLAGWNHFLSRLEDVLHSP